MISAPELETGRSMRIAQISTLCTPVRRHASGSVEGLVWLLTRELTRAGHEVTVFGTAVSEVDGAMVGTLPGPYGAAGSPDDWHVCEWLNLCRAVERSADFDVMHAHAYLWGLPLQPLSRAPLVHTLHVMPDDTIARLWSMHPSAVVTGISHYQWSRHPHLAPAAVIPHGVDADSFHFRAAPSDYLLYFGRFIPEKGPLEAIAAARRLGLRLVLAGPENGYFRDVLRPWVDGRHVEFAGYACGEARDELLGGARALLYPIQKGEPFGLVPAEAMLCGTPVAALRKGAVSELIDEGLTGYSVDAMQEFDAAVLRCFALDRFGVHERARARFSAQVMARAYLEVYARAADG